MSRTAIDSRSPKVKFYMEDMGVIYQQSNGKPDVPHRHDYYTVLLIEKAKGIHIVDFKNYAFDKSEIHFVSPGQVHQVVLDESPQGWVFTFSKEFLMLNNIEESFISNISLFQSFGDTPPLKIDKQTFNKLRGIITDMESCLSVNLYYQNRALGALLQLFLIFCSNSSAMDTTQTEEENKGICILRDFKKLIEENYKDWHKVKRYASEIHISPKHLSQTVKNITGKVAKVHIQDRILLEAKRLLLHTELSIKEIAYEIGFDEPLHFSSFFKKGVGISPSQFRLKK